MPPRTVKTERRRKSRKRPPSLVYVELASGNGGMMRELSEDGFAVRAMVPLRAGENTSFSFSLNETVRIEGKGEILWIGENGHVAGVRFTELSSLARKQIQEWMKESMDSPKRDEVRGKSAAGPPPTLEQLREEIRSGPFGGRSPRAVHAEPVPQAPEIVPTAPVVIPDLPPLEKPASIWESSAAVETASAPAPESVPSPSVISVLLPHPQTPTETDTADVSLPSVTAPVHEVFPPALAPISSSPPSILESDAGPVQVDAALPDISKILIQPAGKETHYAPNPSALGSPTPLEPWPETPGGSWADRFTLSRAITIMLVLALVVAISAYHREVGQVLIWVGEQMGGNQGTQSLPSASNDSVSTSTPNRPSPKELGSPSLRATNAKPATSGRKSATDAPGAGNNSQTSLPSVPQNVIPPVTPLSGVSAAPSSDTSQEAGQTEYVQAMQLLRGQNATVDTSEAVRLLWISVEKGNPSAELALAGLYWYGQGVARNCDQTRILLSAAARKGSVEAQKRLQQFQQEGCE